jgi:hypothetical protein
MFLAASGAAAACVAGSAATNDPPRIVEWHQVGDIGLGMTRAHVEAEYGRQPAQLDAVNYELHGGSVFVAYDAGRVQMISVDTTRYYRAADGFGIGFRIPVGPCRRSAGEFCHFWRGFVYDNYGSWDRRLVWHGQMVEVGIAVTHGTRGAVVGFDLEVLGPAGTSVSPTRAERAGIIAGLRSHLCDRSGTCADLQVTRIRLSKTDRHWAAANFSAPGTQPGYAVLHRGATLWTVVDVGTSDVGCSSAPAKVLHDLGIYCGR